LWWTPFPGDDPATVPPLNPPTPPLTDGIVTLRPAAQRDLAAIEAYATDPDLDETMWLPLPSGADEAQAGALLTEYSISWSGRGGYAPALVIADSVTDRMIGIIHLSAAGGAGAITIGIAPARRRRGLGTRSVDLLTTWAFGRAGVSRLEWETDSTNIASIRLAERCGFKLEQRIRGDDGRDELIYVMNRP
jgi:RimJ/RimL family protein N-acetyltransferase